MNNKLTPQTLETKKCLIVVSAKEQGIIYLSVDGKLTKVEHVTEHPLTHSDNEGFFFRSGNGRRLGSGAPLEIDKQYNIQQYINAVCEELFMVIATEKPEVIFLFEPEHLKGLIIENLKNPTHIPIETIDYGNFVHESMDDIKKRIINTLETKSVDPSDPESVGDEENAQEIRKILEVGQKLAGK